MRASDFGIVILLGMTLLAQGVAAQGRKACNYSASRPVALGDGGAEHMLLLFWAGPDCNTAVAGRAILNADGHPIYMFIEDPNRIRIKEPGVPRRPGNFTPPLAQMVRDEIAAMERTASMGAFPAGKDTGIYPKVTTAQWARARKANRPMPCHRTGYSVSACFWLDPQSKDMQMLFERGS